MSETWTIDVASSAGKLQHGLDTAMSMGLLGKVEFNVTPCEGQYAVAIYSKRTRDIAFLLAGSLEEARGLRHELVTRFNRTRFATDE